MHSTKAFIVVLLAFVVMAATGGYFTGKITTKPTIIETTALTPLPATSVQVKTTNDMLRLNRALSENERLKKELEALEAYLLQEKQSLEVLDQTGAPLPDEQTDAAPQAFRRLSMEDIKAQDPERYERMMTNLQNHQSRMREMRQGRMEFLAGVDTTLLTTEEEQVHTAYLQALSTFAAIEESIWERQLAGESLGSEDFEAMHEAGFAVRELQDAEKTALLNAVGAMYNIPEENLEGFVNTVNEVDAALGGGMRMMGPRNFRGPRP